jgi:hypothetical protein
MQVVGEHGTLWLDFQAKTAKVLCPSDEIRRIRDVNRLTPSVREALRAELATRHLAVRDLPVEENNAILEELREFASTIQMGVPVTAPGSVGRDAVAVAEQVLAAIAAAHRSSHGPAITPANGYRQAG